MMIRPRLLPTRQKRSEVHSAVFTQSPNGAGLAKSGAV